MFDYFEIHLVEHCNLNCRSCDNFSPLANEKYLDINVFKNEMTRISELAKDRIKKIRLLGGEPLLHPKLSELLSISRQLFPNTELLLTTNAIKLNEMSEEFWETCHIENIIIEITYYPININRELIKIKAKHYGVEVIPFANIQIEEKVTHRNPINEMGDQDIESNFKVCYQPGNCTTLKDGKIFVCTCIPNICHFNNYYNKAIPVTENDYLDIYKVLDCTEIDRFLQKAPPFCKYCDIKQRVDGTPWSTTKYDISEWLNER